MPLPHPRRRVRRALGLSLALMAAVTPGVRLHRVMTVNLNAGTIDHVVNGVGAAADTTRVGEPVHLAEYPVG